MLIKDKTIMITGAAGFIAKHLIPTVLAKNPARLLLADITEPAGLPEDSRIEFRKLDITNKQEIESAVRGVNGIFHMAVLPLNNCRDNPELAVAVNVVGSMNLFTSAAKSGVEKVIFSSASSVYGDTNVTMDENHPLGAKSIYGATKIAGEYLLAAVATQFNMKYIILRYMNVFGPGQKAGLIAGTLNRLKQNMRPTIFGDGSQSFDFVHVADVARANVLAMESEISGETFNVGSGEELSVLQVVKLLIEASGKNIEIEYKPAPPNDMRRRVGSSAKIMKMLGYKPERNIVERIKEVAAEELKS